MRIYTFHLLNDFSGSPKVLRQSVQAWIAKGYEVCMVTSSGREGFLSDISGADYQYFWYKLATNRFLRLLFLLASQIILFSQLFFKVKKEDVIYINTVLPFGAALLGILKGCRVIYHLHETSVKPAILKKFLFGWVKLAAGEIIYVSRFLAEEEKIKNKKTYILPNALENDFLFQALLSEKNHDSRQNVLMVCSLKAYKGVDEFIKLARAQEHYQFRLVLNANKDAIMDYFDTLTLPVNLEILPTQTDLHPHYTWADLVLNLSRPDQWVETFGLTIIEAMAYGLPVIVPPVGGVAELVEHGENGFHIDCRNSEQLTTTVQSILENSTRYDYMSEQAISKVQNFTQDNFDAKSLSILEETISNIENTNQQISQEQRTGMKLLFGSLENYPKN